MSRRNKRMAGQYDSVQLRNGDGVVQQQSCVFCGEMKDVSEFYKNGVDENGNTKYRQDCKTCYNIRRNENRHKKSHSDFIGSQKRRGEVRPTLTHQEWKECLIFFGGACAYCGCTMRKGQRMTKDHLLAVSKGGETSQANTVPACPSCNSSKGAKEFKEWFMSQPFFSQERLNKIFQWRTIMRSLGGN